MIRNFAKQSDDGMIEMVAVGVLLSEKRPRFGRYNGHLVRELAELLGYLAVRFLRFRVLLISAKSHFTQGLPFGDSVLSGMSSSPGFQLLVNHIETKCHNGMVSETEYDGMLEEWLQQIELGDSILQDIDLSNINVGMSEEQRSFLKRELVTARRLVDAPFMEKVFAILMEGKVFGDQKIYPFIFNCAPSGCGKTTFALNLATSQVPIFYWLFAKLGTSSQLIYAPFKNISEGLISSIDDDIAAWEAKFGTITEPESIDVWCLKGQDTTISLKTVYIIVDLFKQMFKIKRDNPDYTWMDAQCEISRIPAGEMTMEQGIKHLRKLEMSDQEMVIERETGNRESLFATKTLNEKRYPLCSFIDEASLIRFGSENEPSHSFRERLAFTRSLLRALNIIPIFAGTDARASNLCSPDGPDVDVGRADGLFGFWCCVFNDCPGFKVEVLRERCLKLREKFRSSLFVLCIVDFLETVHRHENPWFISLALEFIEGLDCPTASSYRSEDLLNGMLHYVSTEFIRRKEKSNHVNWGQVSYLHSYIRDPKKRKLTDNDGPERCINGHVAYLKAFAYSNGEPYFKLAVSADKLIYFDQKPAPFGFEPASYYRHFLDAPLTGLVLFGVDLSKVHDKYGATNKLHAPLVAKIGGGSVSRASSLSAVLETQNKLPHKSPEKMLNRSSSGAQLELLYHLSTLIASRANGISGAPFSLFLRNLIVEFSKIDSWPQYPNGTIKLPALECHSRLDNKIIPIIAPMKTPAWPEAVIRLFKQMSNGATFRLGLMDASMSNDPVDSVIYELPTDTCDPATKWLDYEQRDEYGYIEKYFETPNTENMRKALVCECKQLKNAMSLSEIKDNIVMKKFKKNHQDCDLFIVLTMDYSERFEGGTLNELNADGFYMWCLDKHGEGYKVAAMKYQGPPTSQCPKDVLIISLRKIWYDEGQEGSEEELYKSVCRKWGTLGDEVKGERRRGAKRGSGLKS